MPHFFFFSKVFARHTQQRLTSHDKKASLLRNVSNGSGSRCKKNRSAEAKARGDTSRPFSPFPLPPSRPPSPPAPVNLETSQAEEEEEEVLGTPLVFSRLLTTLSNSASDASCTNKSAVSSHEVSCRAFSCIHAVPYHR